MSLLKLLGHTRNISLYHIQVRSPKLSLVLTRLCRESMVAVFRSYHQISLSEEEIEEKFIKGWGKGGQKVNTTSNCVELHHKPTGISVKCHKTRSLSRNRLLARQLLTEKLDLFYNGKESAIAQEIAKKRKLKVNYARKRRLKERVGLANAGKNNLITDRDTGSKLDSDS